MVNSKKYMRARKVEYKGVLFDSLLELRFVILIEDKCSWLREPKTIFYDFTTLKPTNYLTENTRRYTPDFLVRKWSDNSAHIIELKPQTFKNSDQMKIRKQVINNYIVEKGLDWKYAVLSKEDVTLSECQMTKYREIIKQNSNLSKKLELIKVD